MSLMEYAIRQGGVVRAGRVLTFVIAWGTARDKLGDEWPDTLSAQVRAYAEWWKQSERTSWREIKRFREVFPDEETPSRLLDLVQAGKARDDLAVSLGTVPIAV